MEINKHIIQEARTGATKELFISVDNGSNVINRSWGLTGKKFQDSTKTIRGKNAGKANATTDHEQAVKEATAIYDRKIREGYRDFGTEISTAISSWPETFYPLPSSYAPSKPIVNFPETEDPADYHWERKNNGVNMWLVIDENGYQHDYTRGVKEITDIIQDFLPLEELHNHVIYPPKTKISYELVYKNAAGRELPKELRGILNERTTREKSTARYKALLAAGGTFTVKVFDVMFWNGVDYCQNDYQDRRAIITRYLKYFQSEFGVSATPKVIAKAKAEDWEGLVLRKLTGPKSHIEYTLNGKPYRRGAWKYVFNKNDDFIVYEYMLGDSGRLQNLPGRFHLGQYDADGNIVDICWAGPGKFADDDIQELTQTLDTTIEQKVATSCDPFVVLVEFKSYQDGTNALEIPVIQYVRTDKPLKECLFER